jgi:hypothetical protein
MQDVVDPGSIGTIRSDGGALRYLTDGRHDEPDDPSGACSPPDVAPLERRV